VEHASALVGPRRVLLRGAVARACYLGQVPDRFDSLPLVPSLLDVVAELGYTEPTPIQQACVPVLLDGKDLIGQSKTGSGKTAAFALPILQNLELKPRSLQALVVCPTRELSAQVVREVRRLGRRHPGLQVLEVVGGVPVRPQSRALERGVHVVVGTPGRLLDHLGRGRLPTEAIKTVVLDEADRMLDMGFQNDVEEILGALPPTRQTVFFSATFPASIEAMSGAHQRDPVRVTIAETPQEIPNIRQFALPIDAGEGLHALHWVLARYPHESALIFCNFKKTVVEVATSLAASGASVDCLQGDLEQFQRDQVLARFRNRSVRLLVATDVAGRGIDVEHLDLVVNYELPSQRDVYVHRVGRTGRAGRSGVAVSLVGPRDESRLASLDKLMSAPIERLPPLSGNDAGRDAFAKLARAFARDAPMDTILISGGRKDKVRPGDIMGALTGEAAGLDAADVGKIELHDRFCYVAVTAGVSKQAVKSLNRGRIKGRRFRATLVERVAN
jgi:ATP-dependent RNA helicase DbpA